MRLGARPAQLGLVRPRGEAGEDDLGAPRRPGAIGANRIGMGNVCTVEHQAQALGRPAGIEFEHSDERVVVYARGDQAGQRADAEL
jgi:hypothetical protein